MAARSTLTVVSGTTITSAWGNAIRDHAVPSTTADDVAAEGQIGVNTTTDRLMIHDGTAARRLLAYSATGRTHCRRSDTIPNSPISGMLNNTITQLAFATADADPDGFYTGFNGTQYVFTIPAALGGVYAISWEGTFSTGWAGTTQDYADITVNGVAAFHFPQYPNFNRFQANVSNIELAGGQTVWLTARQNSGTYQGLTHRARFIRLSL